MVSQKSLIHRLFAMFKTVFCIKNMHRTQTFWRPCMYKSGGRKSCKFLPGKIAMYSNAAQNYNHSLLFTLRNISFRLLHIFSSHHSVLSFSLPLWHISRNPNLFYFIALSSKSHCKKSIISEANMKWESVHPQLSILIDHEKMNSTSNTSSI